MKNLSDYVAIYKEQLTKGDIQKAYIGLVKYVLTLKASFSKELSDTYSFGNASQGYLDYTYFPFFDAYLRSKKLRFGIVLNHQEIRFELWLMGQNSEIQKQYWDILKTTKWNADQPNMPKYSVLEAVLVDNPNFDNLNNLTARIIEEATLLAKEITDYLKDLDKKNN